MNCIELFTKRVREHPKKTALFVGDGLRGPEEISYHCLKDLAARAQLSLTASGIKPGDSILLLDTLSVRLYAQIIAILALGCSVVLVEPWMSPQNIRKVIELVRPKAFLSQGLGWIWGIRVPSIRSIPHWISTKKQSTHRLFTELHLEQLSHTQPGIITFTSGTTGTPKGVVRTQGYLLTQNEVLSRHLRTGDLPGSDLCIFANFTLMNLAAGRTTVLVPPHWPKRFLQELDDLPTHLHPTSLTSGPAFLEKLITHASLPSLCSIHIGGAQTDCTTFERGFQKWPKAEWGHIYGGSEVEPVACVDARVAVEKSRKRGLHQTLYLGTSVPELDVQIEQDSLWVSGPHVCPKYIGNTTENLNIKRSDAQGRLWHNMSDRIILNQEGWWYGGRTQQDRIEFETEQKIYSLLNSSRSFIYKRWLIGEGVAKHKSEILKQYPTLNGVIEANIYRDRRHRARIDRKKTLQKEAPWIVG